MKIDETISSGKFFFFKKQYGAALAKLNLAVELCDQAIKSYLQLNSLFKANEDSIEAQNIRSGLATMQERLADTNHYRTQAQALLDEQVPKAFTESSRRNHTKKRKNQAMGTAEDVTTQQANKRNAHSSPFDLAVTGPSQSQGPDFNAIYRITRNSLFPNAIRIAGTPKAPHTPDTPDLEVQTLATGVIKSK